MCDRANLINRTLDATCTECGHMVGAHQPSGTCMECDRTSALTTQRERGHAMIRVIRVIQYTYPDAATMEKDMLGWTNSVTGQWKRGMTMQSTYFIPEVSDT